MNNLPIKKGSLIAICIVILLTLLNPTMGNFKEFLGGYASRNDRLTRNANFLLFSTYFDNERTYIGICKNFIRVQ